MCQWLRIFFIGGTDVQLPNTSLNSWELHLEIAELPYLCVNTRGIAMKLLSYFRSFLDNTVNLNDTRIARLNSRVDTVTSFLRGHEVFGEYFIDVVPQGSYAQRTIIKPVSGREFDADVLLAMKQHPTWTPSEYTAELKRAFANSSIYKGMSHKRTRCVYIDYADDFHIDVIPFIEEKPAITNNKIDDWETTDPQAFNAWLEGKSRVVGGGRLQAVIRLLKYVRDSKTTFSIKSVILTILVGRVVESWHTNSNQNYYADVPTALLHVVEDLDVYLQSNPYLPSIMDPAETGRDFRERWDQDGYANFRNWIHYYAGKIRGAYESENVETSLAAWQAVFGSSFKAPKAFEKAASSPQSLTATEQFIDSSLKFPVKLTHQVSLVGRVRPAGTARAYDMPRRGDRVGKNRKIDFSIRGCNVEEPFDIYWKVKNVGPEAISAGQTRGQITSGGKSLEEHTSYVGSHYVEVYIVKNEICVAMDRQPVIIQPR